MTTNQDRAAKVLDMAWDASPDTAAHLLAEDGLLAPDLPRPEDVPEGELAMEEQRSKVIYGRIHYGDTERTRIPEGTYVRRFVTDWEEQA